MIVKPLHTIDFTTIIECFLKAFENYYVTLPTDHNYYKKRWEAAQVNFELSYGMFDGNSLVGFIINAIDTRNGFLTAYNTGTGVIPAYRGKRVVKKIYEHALPKLQQYGIEKCSLEVITLNDKAINAYKSIGFEIMKTYKCYKGSIQLSTNKTPALQKTTVEDFPWGTKTEQSFYSWDNHKNTVLRGNYEYYTIIKNKELIASFVMNPKTGVIAQFNVKNSSSLTSWELLFSGIQTVSKTISITNIDTRLTHKITAINNIGLTNTVDQYELELSLT